MRGILDDDEAIPCPSCPDGNEWDSNGPTGRACRVCKGHALVNRDGSPFRIHRDILEDHPTWETP